MKILVLGGSGYIGGSVAERLRAEGHAVLAQVRSAENAARVRERDMEPVQATLTELSAIAAAAKRADAVINAADAENAMLALSVLDALAGSGKCFIQTSGSSVIADRACGEGSEAIFNEDTPCTPLPERAARVAIDNLVLAAAQCGLRTIVIRPALIYGRGHGLKRHSIQLPKLIEVARAYGVARHVGRGLNIWSHVHIEDVIALYLRALKDAPAGSLFYAENGETSWKDMAASVSRALGLGGATQDWPLEEALAALGVGAITSYGSNSRVRADKARRMLGWTPKHSAILDEIERGCYREDFGPR
ncbi:MAG TPA: NAD-dependent epimerase/dehydratase family protein [Pseudolabrys sp.]|nr:NAD-dependent epimerase/dehydratase family protein [Pseudolabrys sp.]